LNKHVIEGYIRNLEILQMGTKTSTWFEKTKKLNYQIRIWWRKFELALIANEGKIIILYALTMFLNLFSTLVYIMNSIYAGVPDWTSMLGWSFQAVGSTGLLSNVINSISEGGVTTRETLATTNSLGNIVKMGYDFTDKTGILKLIDFRLFFTGVAPILAPLSNTVLTAAYWAGYVSFHQYRIFATYFALSTSVIGVMTRNLEKNEFDPQKLTYDQIEPEFKKRTGNSDKAEELFNMYHETLMEIFVEVDKSPDLFKKRVELMKKQRDEIQYAMLERENLAFVVNKK